MAATYSILVNVNGSDLKKIEIVPQEESNDQLTFRIIDIGEENYADIDISETIIEQKFDLEEEDNGGLEIGTVEVDSFNYSDEPIEYYTMPTSTPDISEYSECPAAYLLVLLIFLPILAVFFIFFATLVEAIVKRKYSSE